MVLVRWEVAVPDIGTICDSFASMISSHHRIPLRPGALSVVSQFLYFLGNDQQCVHADNLA